MRYFFSTGEASGELSATLLATAIAQKNEGARFEGIGRERMAAMGFRLYADTRGWSSMGPISALGKIPKLYAMMWRIAVQLRADPPDLIVLVDFGAFNLRLAKTLRGIGYRAPILYFFPPGAWLDRPSQARAVARYAIPLVAFEHQRDFYRGLELPVAYFGHPLVSVYRMRAPRPAAPADGGNIALLPGSRAEELRYHLPALVEALALLRARRPNLTAVFGAADDEAERMIRASMPFREGGCSMVRGTRDALENAD
ncbi:MAG: hypothetical protein JOZ38_04955, partial [Candidatus Eremiobacteraeota bacterium]|nr:hypothetical protein [Candidatus Eremiobacteraeota bacterium]